MSTLPLPAEVAALLETGETVLWSGQPEPRAYVVRGLPAIAYGISWSVLGAFWYYGSGGLGKFSVFEGWWRVLPLFSVPFILTGFSFFFYPLTLGGRARRTWYVVTDRRAFTAELAHKQKPLQVRKFEPEEVAQPEARKRFDGLFDLLLARRAQENPHLQPRFEDGFLGLPDATDALAALGAGKAPLAA